MILLAPPGALAPRSLPACCFCAARRKYTPALPVGAYKTGTSIPSREGLNPLLTELHLDAISHRALTIDQFTKQAIPFAKLPGHSSSLEVLTELSRPSITDRALDVACGPGIVACHFAPRVAHITGVDITPEMIRQAEKAQATQKITNMAWQIGPAAPLPFPDDSFSLVITRYSFHHFQNPAAVVAEMLRVCRPGGRILIADVAQPTDKVAGYDEIELLRDPSHVHALSREEFSNLFLSPELEPALFAEYKVEMSLDSQLAASFPVPGGAERIRQLLQNDVGVDHCGVSAHWVGSQLHYAVPIVVGAVHKRV
jgi:ubiquinone/menaquinone biosynthesis C-methylase UbiE